MIPSVKKKKRYSNPYQKKILAHLMYVVGHVYLFAGSHFNVNFFFMFTHSKSDEDDKNDDDDDEDDDRQNT